MSGPKIVDIRALRRQMQRESSARLRELRAAMEECLRLAGPEQSDAMHGRASELVSRLEKAQAEENCGELLSEAAGFRDFYTAETRRLRQQFIEKRAAAFRREHRHRQLAARLQQEFRALPASPRTAQALARLDSAGEEGEALAGLVEELAAVRQEQASAAEADRLRALAQSYLETAGPRPEPTLPKAAPDREDVRLERCWAQLGELESLGSVPSLPAWKAQAEKAAAAAPAERDLLLDSLALEMTGYLQAARQRRALVTTAEALLAELQSIAGPEAESHRTALRNALESPEPLAAASASAQSWLAQLCAAEDAHVQRAAILQALGALGYEVREEMTTAWVENGRIVVRKPGESTYGVELASPPAGSAFQARVVATAPDSAGSQRDRDAEQTWCAEFARLRELLAGAGYETKITQALAPGAIPLKTVVLERLAETRRLPQVKSARRADF